MKHWKDIAFGLFVSLTLAALFKSVSEIPTVYECLQPYIFPVNDSFMFLINISRPIYKQFYHKMYSLL